MKLYNVTEKKPNFMRSSFETRLRLCTFLSAILFNECFDLFLCI